jgi:hypothetical protein
MSLADKFNLKTAVEEIKEDLVTDTPSVVQKGEKPPTIANEGDTVDMLEASTPIPIEEGVDPILNPEEDLEQVPDHTEEMEYMASEVSRGFEAIEQLNRLADSLEKREKNNVSLESYNDFALIVINNVRSNLGMESEEGDVTSEKTKSLSAKVIEAIKKIWEKIREFISSIFKKISIYLHNVNKDITDLIKNYLFDQREFGITTIEHYCDIEKIDAKVVYNNFYIKIFEHNVELLINHLLFLKDKFANIVKLDENLSDDNTFKTNLENEIYLHMFDTYSKFKSDVMQVNPSNKTACIKITPDAYLVINDTGTPSVTKHPDETYKDLIGKKVEKQIFLTPSKDEKSLMQGYNRFIDETTRTLKALVENNTSLEFDVTRFVKTTTNRNILFCGKTILDEISSLNRVFVSYFKEIYSGPNYYLNFIKRHHALNKAGTHVGISNRKDSKTDAELKEEYEKLRKDMYGDNK